MLSPARTRSAHALRVICPIRVQADDRIRYAGD
jgi:hypothetical protein